MTNLEGKKLTFEETFSYGSKDKMLIFANGEKIGQFYFNMRGYNTDFDLLNPKTKLKTNFGEYSKSKSITMLKFWMKEGYTILIPFD